MKKKIILKRVFHRGRWRILIMFAYNDVLASLVRQIENSRFSSTHKSWYADDDETVVNRIISIFRDVAEIDFSDLNISNVSEVTETSGGGSNRESPQPEEIKKTEKPDVYDRGEVLPDNRKIEKLVNRQRYSPVEFRINEQDGRLAIRFTGRYDSEWIEEIKSFGRHSYDRITQEFMLP